MSQQVVVIGHGFTSRLGIIRSLAGSHCDITVVALDSHSAFGRLIRGEWGKPLDCHSKYVRRYFYCKNDEKQLIQLLLTHCVDPSGKVVLIPDSDFSAAVIDNNQDILKEHFVFPSIGQEAGRVEYWMNKSRQKRYAEEIGLQVAKGQNIVIRDGSFTLPEGIQYPCFTKAQTTISGGKKFLKRCDTEADLSAVLQRAAAVAGDTNVLVEEYKQIDEEYAVLGFSDGKGEVVIPAVIRFLENSSSHFGIARRGIVMPNKGFESVIAQFSQLMRGIGYCGLFDIDFYESGGVFYFSEINFRFGGSGYAVTKMGVNLPAMLVNCLTEGECQHQPSTIPGTATFCNERMCLDDYLSGALSQQEYQTTIESADIRFVADDEDPGPQARFDKYFRFQQLNRLRKTIFKQR